MKFDKEKIMKKMGDITNSTKEKSVEIADKTKDLALKAKDKTLDVKTQVTDKLDVNNDGSIDIEDIIILGLKTPGIRISRADFLRKELQKDYSIETIETAILETPVKAGIKREAIDKIADEVIKYERNCVSGISAALGTPGGLAVVATLPADIVQYYGYMLRATQKLMYLYGFPEIDVEEKNESFDSETLNILIICLGTMYGVAGANNVIKAMAKGLANGISKKIMRTALTKGVWYPIVKKVAKWFGVNMTKKMLAGAVQKSLPIIGGIIGGGITYASFKPCCDRLKDSLKDTYLSNPDHIEVEEEKILLDENKLT